MSGSTRTSPDAGSLRISALSEAGAALFGANAPGVRQPRQARPVHDWIEMKTPPEPRMNLVFVAEADVLSMRGAFSIITVGSRPSAL